MAKRGAQSDLNHDNWNDEEETEEAGRFTQASEDEMKKRVIKTARRRVPTGGEAGSFAGGSSVFSGFKGFSAAPTAAAKAPETTFSFLSNISKPSNGTSGAAPAAAGLTVGSATTSALGASIFATTDPSKKVFTGFGSPPKEAATAAVSTPTAKLSKDEEDSKLQDYAASIIALNKSVATWISDKLKENPLVKLTPIFKDYEKYLAEIEEKKNKSGANSTTTASSSPPKTGFSFGSVASPSATAASAPAKPFSFGFGSASSATTTASTGFTFANVAKPPESTNDNEDGKTGADADDDEPPKVEFTPVEEKDSIYSKRCKLFVKVDGNYSDRGVGTLHVKKVDTKIQVLLRADTNLGNILLNIILNESIPLQRMGKNNVMMICLPVPESKPPPTSVLLRVKTAEEADELYETLNKYKPK